VDAFSFLRVNLNTVQDPQATSSPSLIASRRVRFAKRMTEMDQLREEFESEAGSAKGLGFCLVYSNDSAPALNVDMGTDEWKTWKKFKPIGRYMAPGVAWVKFDLGNGKQGMIFKHDNLSREQMMADSAAYHRVLQEHLTMIFK